MMTAFVYNLCRSYNFTELRQVVYSNSYLHFFLLDRWRTWSRIGKWKANFLTSTLASPEQRPVECVFEGLLFWMVCDYGQWIWHICKWHQMRLTGYTKLLLTLVICADVHAWITIHLFAGSTKDESFCSLRIKFPKHVCEFLEIISCWIYIVSYMYCSDWAIITVSTPARRRYYTFPEPYGWWPDSVLQRHLEPTEPQYMCATKVRNWMATNIDI